MKNSLFALFAAFALLSCDTSTENDTNTDSSSVEYVLISGNIDNPANDIFTIASNEGSFSKEVNLDDNGNFEDTLYIKDSISTYYLSHEDQYTIMFLKKGYNVAINLDYNDFDNTLTYSGKGSNENNLIAEVMRIDGTSNLYDLIESEDETIYNEGLESYRTQVEDLINNAKDVDQELIDKQLAQLEGKIDEISFYRNMILEEKELFAKLENNPSPSFNGYETVDGTSKSLDDFLGKYLFIDVWATWCGPCLAEVPHLKDLYNDYKDKNITFLSISVDEQKNKEKWKKMVTEEALPWNNVISDNDFNSEFIKAYGINAIPRFILIAPDGKVLRAGAPRPSSDEIRPLLDSLLN